MNTPTALLIAKGLGITVSVTVLAAVLGIVVSFVAGLASADGNRPVRAFIRGYVDVFRGTSAVVQLFWVYFALPLFGVRIDAFSAGVVVLALNTGAYGAEVVRGAIRNVAAGQRDAALAVGMSLSDVRWRVVVPQAIPSMLPPLGNLQIELLKNSALVSLITLSDLTFVVDSVLRVRWPASAPWLYLGLLVAYGAMSWSIGRGVAAIERRFRWVA